MANYAYVHRQTVGFRLFKEAGPDGAPPGNRRFAFGHAIGRRETTS
jgi:hypothetical protein